MKETMTLRARVRVLEQHDLVTQDSLMIARGRIIQSQLQVVYAEYEVRELWEFRVTDRLEILELHSQAEYAEIRLEQSHDRDLIESREAYRLEMAKLCSGAQDIEASLWDLESNYGVLAIRRIHQGRYGVSVPSLHQRPRRKQDPIRRIQEDQYAVFKPYGNKIFWKISNVVPTPRNPQYAVSKTLDTTYQPFSRPYK
ncbi:hypothetical protein Tco_1497715 [Tanacetum coccineum]